jgi:hypothetical protein
VIGNLPDFLDIFIAQLALLDGVAQAQQRHNGANANGNAHGQEHSLALAPVQVGESDRAYSHKSPKPLVPVRTIRRGPPTRWQRSGVCRPESFAGFELRAHHFGWALSTGKEVVCRGAQRLVKSRKRFINRSC